jgi:tRNA (cmo5U34)-methyltransferase
MNALLGLLSMLVREHLAGGELPRTPESMLVMDSEQQVSAWHSQGADDAPIAPVYHLNALACSRFAPIGSTVVDLGCGSGRFAAYLARFRPDVHVVGFDLSTPMVDVGNEALRQQGLASRVELRVGDMTAFVSSLPAKTALINCLFALHHLPTLSHVEQCLSEIRSAARTLGCGFWIFDLVRPRHRKTAIDYPDVFSPNAPPAFSEDSTNSLMAAYSHAELREAVARVFGGEAHASLSRMLPLYQAFWQPPRLASQGVAIRDLPQQSMLPFTARLQFEALRAILPGIPI